MGFVDEISEWPDRYQLNVKRETTPNYYNTTVPTLFYYFTILLNDTVQYIQYVHHAVK